MKVLVIGQGGREHAIVRSLSHSPLVDKIHAVPGNSGMAQEAVCHPFDVKSDAFLDFVRSERFDLVIVGPEQALADGVSDAIRKLGIPLVGPEKSAARLESSKIFAKEFMKKSGVPTARYFVVSSVEQTMENSREFAPPYVLKADGLCAGKGVVICKTAEELKEAANEFFVKKTLGEAGTRALLEEFQAGWELSCHILTNGETYQVLPFTQDHKRIFDRDQGPNTGGMGVVGPLNVDEKIISQIKTRILDPVVKEMKSSGMLYRGVLYVGLMITKDGPTVIEFNVRFGDPETQVMLPLLKGDWASVFQELAEGRVMSLSWKPLHVCAVVLAAPGYPSNPEKGVAIEGDPLAESSSSYFLHAGTEMKNGQWFVNGGRVLNSVGVGSSLEEAVRQAYAQATQVQWQGMQMRTDIGKKVLSNGLH